MQDFRADQYRGKKVRLSASVKAEDVQVVGLDVPTTGMPQQQERPDKPTNLDFQN